jgi:hypothetical protein
MAGRIERPRAAQGTGFVGKTFSKKMSIQLFSKEKC